MFIAYEEYKKNIYITTDNKIINNVIEYNQIDCKVLYNILQFLKKI